MLLQIVIFAAIAAFFLFRLYSVLGRRTGHEPSADPSARPAGAEDSSLREGPRPAFTGPAAAGREAIRREDGRFDPDEFLKGARSAYELIIESFADGDRDSLRRLTTDRVFKRYDAAIKDREEKGLTQVSDIIRVANADITAADLDGSIASVTVAFEADIATAMKKDDGELVEGDPSRIVTVKERWTFERDVSADDPNWLLARVSRS